MPKHKLPNKIVPHSPTQSDIFLILPNDFPFEIDNIFIRHDTIKNTVTLEDERIPLKIKQEIEKCYDGKIEKFVVFLQENLERFFKNEKVTIKLENKSDVKSENKSDYKSEVKPEIKPELNEFEPTLEEFQFSNALTKSYKGPTNVKTTIFTKNVLIYYAKKLIVTVECNRCKKICTIWSSNLCNQCKSEIGIVFSHTINSEELGRLQLLNCKMVSILSSCFVMSCLCGKVYKNYDETLFNDVFNKSYSLLNKTQNNFQKTCINCNTKIIFKVGRIDYIQVQKKTAPINTVTGDGSCKHYKKSFRYFLFPCCNTVHPCDECHDATSGHKAKHASKMICGKCKKQQPVSSACACGMDLKKKSQFWEGGKGTRNKETMSRKDSKKYKK